MKPPERTREEALQEAESWVQYYGRYSYLDEDPGVFWVMVKEPFESTSTIMAEVRYRIDS